MPDPGADMEELLRRASEAYPLKKGEDRWNDIASKLEHSASGDLVQVPRRWKRKNFVPILLFGLLLFSFLVFNQDDDQIHVSVQTSAGYSDGAPDIYSNANSNSKKNKAFNNDPTLVQQQNSVVNTSTPGKRPSILKYTYTSPAFNNKLSYDTNRLKSDLSINNRGDSIKQPNLDLKNTFFEALAVNQDLLKTHKLFLNKYSQLPMAAAESNKNIQINNRTTKNGFYYGLATGIQISRIKYEEMESPGIPIGFIGGYRFNKRIAIESGISFSKKSYYTQGRYFSMVKMMSSMPVGMKMIEVIGSSSMVEIPVHLRYDFPLNKNQRIFFSTGFSSFILTQEENQYNTMLNGIEGKMEGNYKSNKVYLAGAFDLSLGYEKDLGNRNHVRVHPFLQLPLRGIGIGQLRVKTAGLRIALTRSR